MIKVVDHGRGKPLLLVHGLGSSGHAWEPVLRPLTDARRVMVIDLPGHGSSPAEPDSGTFDGLVSTLR